MRQFRQEKLQFPSVGLIVLFLVSCSSSPSTSPTTTTGTIKVTGKVSLQNFTATDVTLTIGGNNLSARSSRLALQAQSAQSKTISVNSDGSFEVDVPSGDYDIEVTVPSHRKQRKKLKADKSDVDLGDITLAEERRFVMSAVSGTLAVLAGGENSRGCVNPVEIYDSSAGSTTVLQLPTNRGRGAAAAYTSIVYIAGGEEGVNGSTFPCDYSASVDILDLQTKQWTSSTLSSPRMELSAASANGKVLFAGGVNASAPSSVVDIYNTTTGTWSTSALSVGRFGMATVVDGQKVYFAGGSTNNAGTNYSTQIDIYDAGLNAWTTASLSLARRYFAAVKVGSKLLFAGGQYNNSGSYTETNRVDIFDTTTSTWSTAALSQPRQLLAAATVGNLAIFSGGEASGVESDAVDIYDANTGTWSTSKLSIARTNLTGFSISNTAVFAGGNYFPTGFSNVVDIFNGATSAWQSDEM